MNSSLPLDRVSKDQAGEYTCRVTTELDQVEASARVQVDFFFRMEESLHVWHLSTVLFFLQHCLLSKVRRQTGISSESQGLEVMEGEHVELSCEVRF